jgi:hypothetical protein
MKITTTIKQETEIEVPDPIFKASIVNDINQYRAIIANTYIELFLSDGFVLLKHADPQINADHIRNMLEAPHVWQDISEQEFLEAHANALKSLSLAPQLVDSDANYIKDVL